MMVTNLRCDRMIMLATIFVMSVFFDILNLSPTSSTCHQHILSPTSVTNIDVTVSFFFSGYKFIDIPFLIGNEFHDTHHKLTNCNYGGYGYFDAIFGSHVSNKKEE